MTRRPAGPSTDAAAILADLDARAAARALADLDHGHSYTIDARITAYADGARWALVVDVVGYNPRLNDVVDVVHTYGDCLTSGAPGAERSDAHRRIENIDDVEDPLAAEEYLAGAPIRVRGQLLEVEVDDDADLVDAFRALVPTHRDLLLADDDERRRRVPVDLPEVLRIDEWHQPDLLDVRPSGSELYPMLAAVLADADPAAYRPTLAANTHWSNWPDAGGL